MFLSCYSFLELQILIWDDRKVFGTRIESMKNDILGDNPPNNGNSLNPSSNPTSNSKAARKDSGTIVKVSCLLSWVDLTSDIELDMRAPPYCCLLL